MIMNRFKTLVLMSLLAGVFMCCGYLLGGTTGLTLAFSIACLSNLVLYFFSDTIVLKMYQAQPFDHQKYPDIEPMVRALCEKMHLPMPRLWLINTPVANAFATGRNPKNSSVVFTTGILSLLEPHEIRGVIAHELSHIYHRDILVTTVAATIAMAISYIAQMAQHHLFFASFSQEERSNKRSTLGMIIAAILMPIVALLIKLGISRSREYLADEMGGHISHDPLALASALEKLHHNTEHVSFTSKNTAQEATASLFIVNPFSAKEFAELFSTHPSVEKRVAALKKQYAKQRRWDLQ